MTASKNHTMDVTANLHFLATPQHPATLPGRPARGSGIVIDGIPCIVDRTVEVGGRLVVYASDDARVTHTVEIPVRTAASLFPAEES